MLSYEMPDLAAKLPIACCNIAACLDVDDIQLLCNAHSICIVVIRDTIVKTCIPYFVISGPCLPNKTHIIQDHNIHCHSLSFVANHKI